MKTSHTSFALMDEKAYRVILPLLIILFPFKNFFTQQNTSHWIVVLVPLLQLMYCMLHREFVCYTAVIASVYVCTHGRTRVVPGNVM